MGKKTKLNSVFKVAGARSLKSKHKAKAINTKLKDLKVKIKDQIDEANSALVNVQDKLRTLPPKPATIQPVNQNNKMKTRTASNSEQNKFDKMQMDAQNVIAELDNVKLAK